jgi:signal transduction histidine kinase
MFVKLTSAFIIVALVATGLVAYLTNVTTADSFGVYYQHMFNPSSEPASGASGAAGRGMMGPGMMGQGQGMMNGSMGQRMLEMFGQQEREFLASVNSSMWTAGAIAVLIAILLSLLLARQFTLPLRTLTIAAKHISSGDLTQRVPIKSRDELGDLATAFNSMAESLSRNEQTRRNMVADIAHELRTPLTVIQGNLEAILDGVIPPTRETVASIHEESMVLARLIADLRELSLAEAGQLELRRSPTDLADLVRKVVARNQLEASEKGIALSIDAEGEFPTVAIDEQRISQVVNNLLSNALRHTGRGGKVMVSANTNGNPLGDQSGREIAAVTVTVTDTGSGIPVEDLPFVFDRFYRPDKSRSRSSGGSGIGLAIVKQLVEAHGGKTWVESAPGEGSKFYFTIPWKPGLSS